MRTYATKRALLIIPVALIVSLIVFFIFRLLPGDAAQTIASDSGRAAVDPARYEELRTKLGLDDPLIVQYGNWLWGLIRLQPGTSLLSGEPVMNDINRSLPLTLELTIFATIIGFVIAVPLGILGAVRQNSISDHASRLFTTIGLAMPSFLAGSLLVLLLVNQFHWLPPLEYKSFAADPMRNLQQMLLPSIVLGFGSCAVLARMTRSSMLEVLRQDYIRTAHSKGLRSAEVLRRHALRNALLPLVTLGGINAGFLLGGSVIVEQIFVLPGMGSRMLYAINHRDWVTVQTMVALFAVMILGLNLLLDLAYGWLDPRIHWSTSGS